MLLVVGVLRTIRWKLHSSIRYVVAESLADLVGTVRDQMLEEKVTEVILPRPAASEKSGFHFA